MKTRKALRKPVDDSIVLRLDEFPELAAALRSGDVKTARVICAQLFDLDSNMTSSAKRAAGMPSTQRTH